MNEVIDGPWSSLERWGRRAWQAVGIILVAIAVASASASIATLVVPLTVAVVIGMICVPGVDWLAARGIPRAIGSGLVLVAIVASVVGALIATIVGVVDQGPLIGDALASGVDEIRTWLDDIDIEIGSGASTIDDQGGLVDDLVGGLAGTVPGLLTGIGSLLIGAFVALFLAFYVLADWASIRSYLGGHIGLRPDVGEGAIDDATNAVRRYFAALTVSSLITAILIGLTMWMLGLPLAFTVAVVTMVTSYVPYLGAFVSGAFASLVALGGGGLEQALIVLAVVLIVQNVVQTLVQTRLSSEMLSIHPIVNLGSTIVGAALAGLLGAMLSAPVVAAIITIRHRVRKAGETVEISDTIDPSGPDLAARA